MPSLARAAAAALALVLLPGAWSAGAAPALGDRAGTGPDAAHDGGSVLDRVGLPTGWQPEGITTDGRWLWSGSLATGELLRADPHSGVTRVLPRSRTDKPAVGIDFDQHRGAIWVAGGPSGEIRAHHARSGRLLATFTVPAARSGSRFVNDLVVTRRKVYATDSLNQELAVVPLPRQRVPREREVRLLPLTGDIAYQEGFNANGVVSVGRWLLVVQSNTGELHRVDRRTGESVRVDLGGASLTNGDGMELDEDTLYVVRNRLGVVTVVDIEGDLARGHVEDELTVPDSDVPTTAAMALGSLWLVNARFGTAEPGTADYWITRLDLSGVDD